MGLAALVVVVCASLVVTSAIDDAQISSDRAEATAEVVNVGALRTTVRFRDDEGKYQQPKAGLKYPTQLVKDQNVRVEYQRSNPENVKVKGRGWTLAFRPALSSMAAGLAVCAALWLLLRWRERAAGFKNGL